MKIFKNHGTNEIISEECYNRLPYCKRVKFARVDSGTITHHYNNDDDDNSNMLLGVASAMVIGSLIDDSYSYNDSSSFTDSNDSFGGFDGGDFGGGGAGSDW